MKFTYVWLTYFCLIVITAAEKDGDDICTRCPSSISSISYEQNSQIWTTCCNEKIANGSCCVDDVGNIYGIDLSNCGLRDEDFDVIYEAENLTEKWETLCGLDISGNVLSRSKLESIPKIFPNLRLFISDQYDILSLDSCEAYNTSCPENSHIVSQNGSCNCVCNNNFYGYRCMKSGTFPAWLFFITTSVVTGALSFGLWYTHRRNVIVIV